MFNPADQFTGPSQQIGGFIGTGDQSNVLKLVATPDPSGEIQVVLEDNDITLASSVIQADGLLDVPPNQQIFFDLEIDRTTASATPTISYELGDGNIATVAGNSIDLSNTAVLDAIEGTATVEGQSTGLAVGLLSSNAGQPESEAFSAVFNDIEITADGESTSAPEESVLFRVNAGGPEVAALDGGPAYMADTSDSNSSFLASAGSNTTALFSAVNPGITAAGVPDAIFNTERFDFLGGTSLQYAFDVPDPGVYEVRLLLGNGFAGTQLVGQRIFDVAVEGTVTDDFNDIDPVALFGNQVGGTLSTTAEVTDGTLNLEFIHGVQNPLVNGIEIVRLSGLVP